MSFVKLVTYLAANPTSNLRIPSRAAVNRAVSQANDAASKEVFKQLAVRYFLAGSPEDIYILPSHQNLDGGTPLSFQGWSANHAHAFLDIAKDRTAPDAGSVLSEL